MIDLEIRKLVAGGDGLGFHDGKAVFVSGVLPGERVRARIQERRRDFDRAALVEIIEPSPDRVTPACALAGVCGGCDWLHIGYGKQLELKKEIVLDALRRVGGLPWGLPQGLHQNLPGGLPRPALQIEAGPPLRYRNRVQVHRDKEGGLGYMSRAGNRVVPVRTCPVAVAPIDGVFEGLLPSLPALDRFTVWSDGNLVAVEGIDDERDLSVRVCGRDIVFSVGCFFQSNLAVLEKLVPYALEGSSTGSAADLYCGVGLFGAFLAERFTRVVAVESSSASMAYARRNIRGSDTEFYPMSVEQWIQSGAGRGPFDVVVVDPPRAGLGSEVRKWLYSSKPGRLVYVSCDPVTLARDLHELLAGGFALDDIRLFDFFPQTSHVESVAKLRPQG